MSNVRAAAQRWLPFAVTALVTANLVGLATIPDDDGRDRPGPAAAPTTSGVETTDTTAPPTPITTEAPTPINVPDEGYKGPVTMLSGRVLDFGGKPVQGVEVRVQEHLGFVETFGRVLAGLVTFGLYCRSESAPVDCKQSSHGVSDAGGRYTIRLFAGIEEVRAADDFDLIARAPTGAETIILLPEIPSANSVAPDLTIWEPMRIQGSRATWRAGRDPATKYTLTFGFDERNSPKVVYSKAGQPNGVEFEPRILEDMSGWAQARATLGKTTWTTPQVPFNGPGAPMSRNRPCTVVPDDPKVKATRFENCPATDTDDFTRLNTPYPAHKVVLDLGAARRFTTAIVSGLPGDFTVEVSNDNATWAAAMTSGNARSEGEHKVLTAASPQNARYVRLTSEWSLFSLRHLSVW